MKIFISQKMRDKTEREIWLERENIKGHWVKEHIDEDLSDLVFIESYNSELKHKSPIDALSHSLAMLDEADIVLVPKGVIDHIVDMNAIHHVQSINDNDGCAYWTELSPDFIKQYIKGCEFEFQIALSYGKKVYTYDENYTFEEVS